MKTLLSSITLITLLLISGCTSDNTTKNEVAVTDTAIKTNTMIDSDLSLTWALDGIDSSELQTALVFDFSDTSVVASLGK